MAGSAEGAEKGVDCFIATDADKEVIWGEIFLGVDMRVAEIYQELFEFVLVAL